jgi:pimeloyl-ACP methyl ester carboxylesterase
MHHGDFEQVARRSLMRSGRRGPQYSTASFWVLDSSSGITAKRRAEFESDPAMKIIGSTFSIYAQGSPVWKSDLGDDFRQNFETEVPTVIVHGTWDTSTPYENALELAPYFKNSKFVTVKRGSHGALGEALAKYPSFAEGLNHFVVSGDMSELPSELELPSPTWVVPDLSNKE